MRNDGMQGQWLQLKVVELTWEEVVVLKRPASSITKREGLRGWVGMGAEARKSPAEDMLCNLMVK